MGRNSSSLNQSPLRLGLVFFISVVLVHPSMARTWKSTNGTEIEGEVFQVKDERVGLRIDGRDYFFSISRFQKADQIYLRKWGAEERCGSCAGKINGEFREAGDKKYHRQCFRCLACRKVFEGGDRLAKDPWGGLVHMDHQSSISTCDSCTRFFRRDEANPRQFFRDGRVTCGVCFKDGVFGFEKVYQVRDRIVPILRGVGMELKVNSIRIELVDRAFLNREATRIKATGKLRGLTLTKYKITRGLNLTDASFEHRIYLLSGLPYVECISVLAHEYAHVWLNERFIEIAPMEMEGFCNLISEICLAQDKSKASTLLRENMIQSKDPIYGRGFREMRARLKALGWNQLLAEMLSKSSPP